MARSGLAVGFAAYFFRWDTAPSRFLEGTHWDVTWLTGGLLLALLLWFTLPMVPLPGTATSCFCSSRSTGIWLAAKAGGTPGCPALS